MKQKILVIEDNDDIRGLLISTLTMFEFEVETAVNGPDGVRAAQKIEPDLILSDIMLPFFNGYEVYHRLVDAGLVPTTPFVFLTALDSSQDVRRGMLMGADDYIVKPFNPKELVEALREVLRRRARLRATQRKGEGSHDIFISYSHSDRSLMHRVRNSLETAGFDVWTDELLDQGDDWEQVIAEAIRNTGCVLPLLTENSAQSRWVRRELSYAELNGTRILPLLLRGDQNTSVPLRLSDLQFIDGRGEFAACVDQLVTALRAALAQQ